MYLVCDALCILCIACHVYISKAQCLHKNTAQEKGAHYAPPHFVNLTLYMEISNAEYVAIYIKYGIYMFLMSHLTYVELLCMRMYLL